MTVFEEPPRYKTFLLTVWEERNLDQNRKVTWRFGLEDPHTGQRRAYSGPEALFDALQRMISAAEATKKSRASFTLPTHGASDPNEQSSASSDAEE